MAMLWLEIAFGELADHVAENPAPGADNPRIVEYHAATTLKAKVDEVPWCSAFVCWCMERAGLSSTRNAAARSWLTWAGGGAMQLPRLGCIIVLQRGEPGSAQGHVGFYLTIRGAKVALLGGNQANHVGVDWFDADKIIGMRWPKGCP